MGDVRSIVATHSGSRPVASRTLRHKRRFGQRGPYGSGARGVRERGTAIIEAAFVTLLFFTFIFAIIDGGILLLGDNVVIGGTRAGARAASAGADALDTDYVTLQRIKKDLSAIKANQILHIVVYKATRVGGQPTATCMAGTPALDVCNTYVAADLLRPVTDFQCKTTQDLDRFWCPSVRKTARNGPPDYVGIYIEINQPLYTYVFGKSKKLTARTVVQVEPRKAI
jgi:Flp pilus assembly protein TadG